MESRGFHPQNARIVHTAGAFAKERTPPAVDEFSGKCSKAQLINRLFPFLHIYSIYARTCRRNIHRMQGVWMNFNSGYPQRGREAKSLPLRPLFSRPGRKTLRLRVTYPQTVQRLWITRFVWKVLGAGADMQSGHGLFCFGFMRQTRAGLPNGTARGFRGRKDFPPSFPNGKRGV